MRKTIKSKISAALLAVVLFSPVFGRCEDKNPIPISKLSGYDMVKVKGNIKLYLTQGMSEKIVAETEDGDVKVSFKREGRKLTISTLSSDLVSVYLTVKDLVRIEACENAIVQSGGCFNLPLLQVFVDGKAKVDVNINAKEMYTVVKAVSSLKLRGSAIHHISIKDNDANLNVTHFAALNSEIVKEVYASVVK